MAFNIQQPWLGQYTVSPVKCVLSHCCRQYIVYSDGNSQPQCSELSQSNAYTYAVNKNLFHPYTIDNEVIKLNFQHWHHLKTGFKRFLYEYEVYRVQKEMISQQSTVNKRLFFCEKQNMHGMINQWMKKVQMHRSSVEMRGLQMLICITIPEQIQNAAMTKRMKLLKACTYPW